MGAAFLLGLAVVAHDLLQSRRAATTYAAQSNSRLISRACPIFQALMSSAFLIRCVVVRQRIVTQFGKQSGTLLTECQSLWSVPKRRIQP